LALTALATLGAVSSPSAEAQQWAPAGGPHATVAQRLVPFQSQQAVVPVRYQSSAVAVSAAGAPVGPCRQCGNAADFCNWSPAACANGMCAPGCYCANGQCHCANGPCQCADGQCECANGQCGCICPPGACERGECSPDCPCPGCNATRPASAQWQARPAGLNAAMPQSVSRPITHSTLRRPVIADAPANMVTASL